MQQSPTGNLPSGTSVMKDCKKVTYRPFLKFPLVLTIFCLDHTTWWLEMKATITQDRSGEPILAQMHCSVQTLNTKHSHNNYATAHPH